METLLILTYTAICVLIFKVFKIPLNKWSIPTAVLGGVFLIGGLVFVMNYNHPYSEISRAYFVTVPIVPEVKGQVIEVPVKANQSLKEGDILLKLDATPFEAEVASLKAELVTARIDLDRAKKLTATDAVAQRALDVAQQRVDELTPELASAQWELDNTVVRAPSDGFVTQLTVRPGIMAVSMPLRPVMVFVPYENYHLIGWFHQNNILRLEPGSAAEVALDGIPGEVFSAEVSQVLPAMSQGQISASGSLMDGSAVTEPGRIGVVLKINDPEFEQYKEIMPAGVYGQAAIYSEHVEHVAIIRKILLRMSAWLNYIFPFH